MRGTIFLIAAVVFFAASRAWCMESTERAGDGDSGSPMRRVQQANELMVVPQEVLFRFLESSAEMLDEWFFFGPTARWEDAPPEALPWITEPPWVDRDCRVGLIYGSEPTLLKKPFGFDTAIDGRDSWENVPGTVTITFTSGKEAPFSFRGMASPDLTWHQVAPALRLHRMFHPHARYELRVDKAGAMQAARLLEAFDEAGVEIERYWVAVSNAAASGPYPGYIDAGSLRQHVRSSRQEPAFRFLASAPKNAAGDPVLRALSSAGSPVAHPPIRIRLAETSTVWPATPNRFPLSAPLRLTVLRWRTGAWLSLEHSLDGGRIIVEWAADEWSPIIEQPPPTRMDKGSTLWRELNRELEMKRSAHPFSGCG